MTFNLATTLSLASAAVTLAVAAVAARLGRGVGSHHFRYAVSAALAGAVYCGTDAVLAGELSTPITVWAGRLNLVAVLCHALSWVAFLAAWDNRKLSRLERGLVAVGIAAAFATLVPGWAIVDSATDRRVPLVGVTYRDPDVGPLAIPVLALAYVAQVVAGVAALRTSRRAPEARVVVVAFTLLCAVGVLDVLSGVHVTALPYLSDPVLAITCLSIGSVVAAEAAESAHRSADLQQARAMLAEQQELAALGQLAAVVAHEVRNPVAIIFGALASLRRAERSKEDAMLLGIVGDEAERLKQLIARLLDAVRPFELQYSRQAAQHVVRGAISQVTASAGVPASQVEMIGAPPDELECDEVLLGQAISNLVQNALVAPGRRSPVRVQASLEPSARPEVLRVEISDDGDGVPPEARPKLFTPFFTTRATGTGLGLALVKRIAEAHGGPVTYEPQAVGGASFVLRVPLRERERDERASIGTGGELGP